MIRFNIIVWLMVILILPAGAGAADKITFSLLAREWPPFEMVIDGKPLGASVDLFKELMPQDMEALVETIPASRSVLRKQGKPIYTRLEAREWFEDPSEFLWSEPVLTVKTVLYSSINKTIEYTGPGSLHGLKIGCIKQYYYPEVQPLFDSGVAERYDVNSSLVLLRMLKAGRVDVAVFTDVVAAWLILESKDVGVEDFYVSTKAISSSGLRFVFNKDEEWEKRLPELNQKIASKRAAGTIERIMSNYR